MRALVTGAGGFVGPHLVDHLLSEGDDVTALGISTGPNLTDGPGWVSAVADAAPEVIYHLAGLSDVGGSWDHPVETFSVNTMGTVHVLEAARAAGSPIVVIVSSADVYGAVTAVDLPLTETAPVRPRSPYGASKAAAETAALQYWLGRGVGAVVVRPFNHLGAGQSTRFAAASFASQIASLERSGGGTLRHGDLSPRRDLTDVRDIVRAYRMVALKGQPGETYNVCSGHSISMQAMLGTLLDASTAEITCEVDPDLLRPVEIPVMQGSFAKLEAATGWSPRYPLTDTLAAVLADARERASLPNDL